MKLKKISAILLTFLTITSSAATANAAVIGKNGQINAYSSTGYNSLATADEADFSALPSYYNGKEELNLYPPRVQKYNACWAYAGTAAFEAKLAKSSITAERQSETFINYFGTPESDNTGWIRSYTDSGYSYITVGAFTSWSAPLFEEQFPLDTQYNGFRNLTKDLYPSYGATAIEYLDGTDRDDVKRAIIRDGAVVASFSSLGIYYSSDNTSYCFPKSSPSNEINGHTIALVGWDDSYSKENFSYPPESDGAFLVKNSWGVNNSLGGYFWISYEDKYLFDPMFGYGYSVRDFEAIDEKDNIYQNEIYGATYEYTPHFQEGEITYISQFDFKKGYTNLDKIVFETLSSGLPYTVYFIPVEGGMPTSDTSKWTELYSDVTDYSGYICADIDDYTVKEGKGAVGIKMTKTSGESTALPQIGVCEWLTQLSPDNFIFRNKAEYGKCFISYNGTMTDLMDDYKNKNDTIGGTFVIKAIADTGESFVQIIGDTDLDMKLSIKDVTLIQKFLANIEELTRLQKKNADFNKNDKIDITDATSIQRSIANSI